jgi:15-cis-phytoene synthase
VISTNRHGVVILANTERAGIRLDAAELLAGLPTVRLTPSTSCPPITLRRSYRLCEQITRIHSRSFFFSSQLLPREKRRAVRALYALCRTSDDIVDTPQEEPAMALAHWVAQVRNHQPPPDNPILIAWEDTRCRYNIPQSLVDELLAGIAMDLSINRYATFEDLWLYCYRVASVVGLLAMQIIGYQDGATPYAIKLGVALQLTNILRDVGEDARRGRIYLPQEDLRRFGIHDSDILAGQVDQRFVALMQYQIQRAQQLYAEAQPGIALLSRDSRLAIAASAEVYRAILARIETNSYNTLQMRASVPLREKLRILWRLAKR